MKILHAFWDGGGNTAPQLAILRELKGRGHEVISLGHSCQREKVEGTGVRFQPYEHAPDADSSSPETDPIRDWEAKTPVGAFARTRDNLMYGPSALFARDVVDAGEKHGADAVVWDFMLIGAAIGAERLGVPSVALVHTIYPLPTPGVPPFGQGFAPAAGPVGRARDALMTTMLKQAFAPGMKPANATRAEFGLAPYASPFDPMAGADRLLVLTSPAFDFAGDADLPGNVAYTGPITDAPATPVADGDGGPPLVLASFSTTYMGQDKLAARTIEALGALPVRGLVTTGPAIEPARLPQADNVEVKAFVPHAEVLPQAALMITHGGLGTVHAALAHGVPLVCLPDGRDQPDNAARVVAHGAGLRVRRSVKPAKLRATVEKALANTELKVGAQRLADDFAKRDGAKNAADAIESLV